MLLELNVICSHRWIQFEMKNCLSRAIAIHGKIQSHLANLQNRITTKTFDMFRIITKIQEKFCQSDPVLSANFQKNCSPTSPDPCSSLIRTSTINVKSTSVSVSELFALTFFRVRLQSWSKSRNPDPDPNPVCNTNMTSESWKNYVNIFYQSMCNY